MLKQNLLCESSAMLRLQIRNASFVAVDIFCTFFFLKFYLKFAYLISDFITKPVASGLAHHMLW